MYLRESQSIEKCSISATNITDEELTSFFVKLNLALQLNQRQTSLAISQWNCKPFYNIKSLIQSLKLVLEIRKYEIQVGNIHGSYIIIITVEPR